MLILWLSQISFDFSLRKLVLVVKFCLKYSPFHLFILIMELLIIKLQPFRKEVQKKQILSQPHTTNKSIFEQTKLFLEELEDVKKIPIHH